MRILHHFPPVIVYSLVTEISHQFELPAIDNHHIFFVQSQICLLQVMKLTEHHRSAEKHRYSNDKLHADKPFKQRSFLTRSLSAFESQQRIERRHIKSRERPGQATDPYNTEQDKQQGLPVKLQGNIFFYKLIEGRQQQLRQRQSQYQRKESLHQTFRQELCDQHFTLRPRHFPDTDLFIPQGSAGSRQGCKVESAHKDNQQG